MPPLKALVIQLVSHSLVATNKESGATLPELQWTSVVYFGQTSQAFSAAIFHQ